MVEEDALGRTPRYLIRAYVLRASAAAASMIAGGSFPPPPPSILGEDADDFDPGPATAEAEAAAAAGGERGDGLFWPGGRFFCSSLRCLCFCCFCCRQGALRFFFCWPGAATTTAATTGGVAAGSEGWGGATATVFLPLPAATERAGGSGRDGAAEVDASGASRRTIGDGRVRDANVAGARG